MNRIGAFICNYNGRDYTIGCIRSLMRQTRKDFDIFVVDNASTDGSVEAIQAVYPGQVQILQNDENLGGAGGFDRGLRHGMGNGYEYIALFDNDIILDGKWLENAGKYLDGHGDTGLVGSKVMIMDEPDTVQDYGDYLDFTAYKERNAYTGCKDDGSLPGINVCDYVPTCAVMVKADALRQSGGMPVGNFIYYDDIELCHKIVRAGYKIAALGNVKVWHKGGFRKAAVNTFSQYYFLRNRLHFFAKYIEEEKIGNFMDTVLSEIFLRIFGFYNKGMTAQYRTLMYAFDDFLHQVRGKAEPYKILGIEQKSIPIESTLKGKGKIQIEFMDNYDADRPLDIFNVLINMVGSIDSLAGQDEIFISLERCSYSEGQFKKLFDEAVAAAPSVYGMPKVTVKSGGVYEAILCMCGHVKDVQENILPKIWIDRFMNCIVTQEDYIQYKGLAANENFFKALYKPLMERAIGEIRGMDDGI